MGTQEEREKVRSAVRALLEADRVAGGLKSVDHYHALFAGFSDLVAEEHALLAKDGRSSEGSVAHGATVTSDRLGTPLPSGPSGPDLPLEIERLGPYRVLKELGRGGMGVVYLAEDGRIGRRVALKVLPAHFASSRHLQARFHREAALASKLDHPHICTVYEAGEADGVPYMAMRYLEGKPLSEWVGLSRESKRPSGVVTLPPIEVKPPEAASSSAVQRRDLDRLLLLFEKAARALHAAHEKGLIHRDIKPHNIMVTAEGEPVLLDFGLAREEEGEGQGLTQTGSLMGTPAYLSPEQLAAQRIKLDRRTDVYSLGVTLYECLTLKLPFEAPTLDGLYQKILMTEPEAPRRLNRSIPRDLQVVVETAIERNRERRYQRALDLAEELRRVREHEPIRAKPVGSLTRLGRWAQRNPAVAALCLVVLVSFAGWSLSTLAQLRKTRILALVAASEAARAEDPMESLLLAREAAKLGLTPVVENALHAAVGAVTEVATLGGADRDLITTRLSPSGDAVLTVSRGGVARIWDLDGRERAVLRGHEGDVVVAEFSPEGSTVLTGSRDGSARLWDLKGRELARLPGHGRPVMSVSFNPSGTRFLSVDNDGWMSLGDCEGKQLAFFKGDRVRDAVLSPDGTRVLAGSLDGSARLWSDKGEEEAVLAHGGTVWTVALSPDGSRIVTAGHGGNVRLWTSEGASLGVLRGHSSLVTLVAFSPSGDRFLTASPYEGEVRLWDFEGREVAVLRQPTQVPFGITSASFSPTGDLVLTASGGNASAWLWDLDGRVVAELQGHEAAVWCATFSGTGGVLTASADGTARVWNRLGSETACFRGHMGRVRAAYPAQGERVLTVGDDGTARLWSRQRSEVCTLRGHEGAVSDVSFAPSGGGLLTVSSDRTARLWDSSGRQRATIEAVSADHWRPRFSSDGEWILVPGTDGTPRLLDAEGTQRAILRGHGREVTSAAFTAADDAILTASHDGTARKWDLAGQSLVTYSGQGVSVVAVAEVPGSGQVVLADAVGGVKVCDSTAKGLSEIAVLAEDVDSVAFSSSGDRILFLCRDGVIRIRAPDGQEIADLRLPSGVQAKQVGFSPAGDHVLAVCDDKAVRVWSARGAEVATLQGHRDELRSGTFSPRGDRILTASMDGTARLWDLGGQLRCVLRGHAGGLTAAVFSSSGDRIATASEDGTALVWFSRPEDILRLAEERVTRDFTPEERAKYVDLLEPGPGK